MAVRWHRLGWIACSGALIAFGEAAGRFAWLGRPAGLVFPPEALSQWFFAVIPMRLFALGIRLFGEAAKWWAFAGFILLWTLTAGACLHLIMHGLRRAGMGRSASSLAGGLLFCAGSETLWLQTAEPLHLHAPPLDSAAAFPVLIAYLAAAWLVPAQQRPPVPLGGERFRSERPRGE